MRQRRVDVAIEQDHRDAGILGRLDCRNQRLFLAWREEDQVDPLGDHRIDIGHLLGGGAGGIRIDQLPPALLGFFLHAGSLGKAPWIVAFGLGKADLVGVFLLERRRISQCAASGHGGSQPDG